MLKTILKGITGAGLSALVFLACSEKPAKRVELSDLAGYEGKNIEIDGHPFNITTNGFNLEKNGDTVHVARVSTLSGGRLEIDLYSARAGKALEQAEEAGQNVSATGTYSGNNTLEGRSVEVNGKKYSISR